MRIIELREVPVPLHSTVSNAAISFAGHRVSLVAVVTDVVHRGKPLVGVAFNSIGRHSQGGLLRERMFPRVKAASPQSLVGEDGLVDPALVLATMLAGEKPGGHGDRAMAAAAVELACWDALAKYHGEPAHETIARAFGRPANPHGVEVYAAGGYYREHDDGARLRVEIEGYLQAGYTSVKIKVGGLPMAEDAARVAIAVSAVGGCGDLVAVDANGAMTADIAVAYAHALEPFGLRWFEEPVDPLDYASLATVVEATERPVATGENLFSLPDVANLLRYGGLRPDRDVLQMDAGLSYGLTEYAAMIDALESAGFDRSCAVPHGGHLINLHIVTGLGLGGCEAYPGVFEPFGGFSPDCELRDGRIRAGEAPGFGLEEKPELRNLVSELLD